VPVPPLVNFHVIPTELVVEVEENAEMFRQGQWQQQREQQQQHQLEDVPFINNEPVAGDVLEGEEENDVDEEEQVLVEEQGMEDEQQHIINYAVNLPVEATAIAGLN
jgi:hypothetical protein